MCWMMVHMFISDHYLFGTSLVAFKKNGGIQPIAVGSILCCLAAKCAGKIVLQSLSTLLIPRQVKEVLKLQFMLPCAFLHHLLPDQVMVKLN